MKKAPARTAGQRVSIAGLFQRFLCGADQQIADERNAHMLNGIKSRFFRQALLPFQPGSRRRIGFNLCADTTALMYFRKSTPHLSHVPPWRCS